MIISNKYKIIKKIGEGAFGSVYIGEHIFLEKQVAIKISHKYKDILITNEARIYKLLQNTTGVPNMLMYGVYSGINYLIMEKMDYDLERIDKSNVYLIGIEMFKIIETIHSKGVIHRDIKPENFMFKNDKLYLIDYGLSTMYIDLDNNHIKQRYTDEIIGSKHYISLNIHNNMLPSRRDDLESIVYVLIYLLNDNLPWENLDNIHIQKSKEHIICSNKLLNILNYIRGMSYSDTPNYKFIYKQLKD
jgi:serine/threonine protein kinase